MGAWVDAWISAWVDGYLRIHYGVIRRQHGFQLKSLWLLVRRDVWSRKRNSRRCAQGGQNWQLWSQLRSWLIHLWYTCTSAEIKNVISSAGYSYSVNIEACNANKQHRRKRLIVAHVRHHQTCLSPELHAHGQELCYLLCSQYKRAHVRVESNGHHLSIC